MKVQAHVSKNTSGHGLVVENIQHPTKQQLNGHLPPISKTIQIKRTRHEGTAG